MCSNYKTTHTKTPLTHCKLVWLCAPSRFLQENRVACEMGLYYIFHIAKLRNKNALQRLLPALGECKWPRMLIVRAVYPTSGSSSHTHTHTTITCCVVRRRGVNVCSSLTVDTYNDMAFGDIFLHLLTGHLTLLSDEFGSEDFCSVVFDSFLLTSFSRWPLSHVLCFIEDKHLKG